MLSNELQEGRKITKDILTIIEGCVSHRHVKLEGEKIDDVFDAYLQEPNSERFTQKQIAATLFVFLPDATYTSPIMARWLLLYLANHPKTQDDIFNEVKDICGGEIKLTFRPKMPVTESFIMEVYHPFDIILF